MGVPREIQSMNLHLLVALQWAWSTVPWTVSRNTHPEMTFLWTKPLSVRVEIQSGQFVEYKALDCAHMLMVYHIIRHINAAPNASSMLFLDAADAIYIRSRIRNTKQRMVNASAKAGPWASRGSQFGRRLLCWRSDKLANVFSSLTGIVQEPQSCRARCKQIVGS